MKSLNNMQRIWLIRTCAIIIVLIPAAYVVLLHSAFAPRVLTVSHDTFNPGDPQFLFNDITPGDRTKVLQLFDGARVRPVTQSPVYILFQPRRHSKKIIVTLEARSQIAGDHEVQIGYRGGVGPEHNVLATAEKKIQLDGWYEWHAEIPFEKMVKEHIDARRIVFSFPHKNGEVWMIRAVKIYYEE